MDEHFQADIAAGLSAHQVEERRAAGLVNTQVNAVGKSVGQIIAGNIFTYFNLINTILAVLLIAVGSFKNMLFVVIVAVNIGIGIVQGLRAKRTLDRLSLIAAAQATVVRDGTEQCIPIDGVVRDELLVLAAGDQICADARVRDGALEVNESLLTGESDVVVKKPGDALLSGSYVVSGKARAQAEQVGAESYAYRLTRQAKAFRKPPSELRRAIDRILKVIGIVIIPLGAGLFLSQYFAAGAPLQEAVVGTVAAALGMIPEGLVLLTTIALAVGAVNLGRRRALLHDLFCIETLARVDVLCLDKTGTLTEGRMQVNEVLPAEGHDIAGTERIMGALLAAVPDENVTALALRAHFAAAGGEAPVSVVPFSSERKYSAACFEGRGSLVMGAYEFIFPAGSHPGLDAEVLRHTQSGARVIALASSDAMLPEGGGLPPGLVPCALVLLGDVLRPDAAETLAYFTAQDVQLMVISGDHPAAVASIAAKAGLPGAERWVDATTLETPEDITEAIKTVRVFGRVTPEQKKQIVAALKAAGHTVAMTGDGVNDVPALKEADCAVAMAAGSDAAKSCADVVLLDSNFAAMPATVNEGRRVINNIQNAASLFLVKTIFSVAISLLTLIFSMPYPFMPIHLTVISAFAVGLPTFILSMEPNYERVKAGFFRNVLANALTGAITIIATVLVVTVLTVLLGWDEGTRTTLCALCTGIASLYMIRQVYPMATKLRKTVFAGMFTLYFGCMLFVQRLMEFVDLPYVPTILAIIFAIAAPHIITGMARLATFGRDWYFRMKARTAPSRD